jgi:hypothetical protein
MAGARRTKGLSVRVYEVLITAYPASFRREYGEEMALVFGEHMTDTFERRGTTGLMTAWFRVLGDLSRTVPAEHFHEMQRRIKMKSAAMAVLSVVLAAITHVMLLWGTMLVVCLPLILIAPGINRTAGYVIFYLSAFLAGLLLTRVKPFLMPAATVPIGIMAMWLIWGIVVVLSEGSSWLAPTWGMLVVRIVFVTSLGLAALLGSIVATKASNRLSRFAIPWFQLAGSLAVLVCTSVVVSVLRLMLTSCQLEGNPMASDLQRVWGFCLFAMLVISAVTIANLVLLVIRNHRNAVVR